MMSSVLEFNKGKQNQLCKTLVISQKNLPQVICSLQNKANDYHQL